MEEVKIQSISSKPLVADGKVFRSSNDYELSPEDVEKARVDLNETEETRNSSLRILREMLSREGIRFLTDDGYLLRFLRFKKFKCKEAFKMVKVFHSVRSEDPDIFYTLPLNLKPLLDLKLFYYLPYRDEDGSIIFVDKFVKWKPMEQSLDDLVQLFQTLADVVTVNPACQISKIIGIFDFEGTSSSHLAAGISTSAFKWIKASQAIHPWRVKYAILVNCNKMANLFLNAVRYLLKKKISDRIVIIGSDMKELHKYINPAILPKEYGGMLEDSECSMTPHIMANVPYLKYEHSLCNVPKV